MATSTSSDTNENNDNIHCKQWRYIYEQEKFLFFIDINVIGITIYGFNATLTTQ